MDRRTPHLAETLGHPAPHASAPAKLPGTTSNNGRLQPTDQTSGRSGDASQDRRRFMLLSCSAMLSAVISTTGCNLFSQNKEDRNLAMMKASEIKELPAQVGQAVAARGLEPIKVTGVGLVDSLPGSGGAPDPSILRDALLDDMNRSDVSNPNHLLEKTTNALVQVHAYIPAGAKRGDRVDVYCKAPSSSNTENLHGGWLLDSRLRVEAMVGGRLSGGDVMAISTGQLTTRGAIENSTELDARTQARILRGATVQQDREIGLWLRPDFQNVSSSIAVSKVINERFFFFDGSTRRGVAEPVNDDFLRLELHPRYDNAIGRYIAVINSIILNPGEISGQERLEMLAEDMKQASTASKAALQLEAIGDSGIPVLLDVLANEQNPELRFYAAESLAYLNRKEAIPVLEQSIISEPAFRHSALLALQGVRHPEVITTLERLFHQSSLEARYGAFHVLRKRSDSMALLAPSRIDGVALYYNLESDASPAVVISTHERQEIVVFGEVALDLTSPVRGPSGLIVKPSLQNSKQISLARFQVGKRDRRVSMPATLQGLAQGVASIGGDYGDVISLIKELKNQGHILAQVAIDPLPESMRTYYREQSSE